MSDLPFKLKSTIFIISPPHSGSTLLRNMLAQHPNLYSPPELYLLPFISMAERIVTGTVTTSSLNASQCQA